MRAHRPRPSLSPALIAGTVAITSGVYGALFEVGSWLLGFCVLGLAAVLVYLERSPRTPVAVESSNALDGLVVATKAQWTSQLENLGVFEWQPLRIRWKQLDDPSTTAGEPCSSADIGEFYKRVESGRLVILGSPGAGKTVLAIQLTRQLLQSWNRSKRVPVFVSLSSWNPAEIGFSDWLKKRLAINHPSLSAVDSTGRRIVDTLVDGENVLPILDGLDELSPPRRRGALAAITRMAPFPFVLTCQSKEYAAVVRVVPPPRDTVAVMIEPLRVADIRAYLTAGEPDSESHVVDELLLEQDDRLTEALSTPLMCFLTKVGYTGSLQQATELSALARRPPAAFEEHLLERFVPAVFNPLRRGPKPVRDWDTSQAVRWLSYLARDLVRRGERDLVPWRMYEGLVTTGRTKILLGGVLSWCVLGVVIGAIGVGARSLLRFIADRFDLATDPIPLLPMSWTIATTGAAVVVLVTLQSVHGRFVERAEGRPASWKVEYLTGGMVRLLVGVVGGAGILLLAAAQEPYLVVLAVALTGGLLMGSITWALAGWSREWRVGRSPRRIRIRVRKIPDALVYGFGGGLATGLGAAIVIGVEASAFVAVPAVAVGMVVNLLDERADEADADHAAWVLASDRWATLLQLLSCGTVVGVFTLFVNPGGTVMPLLFGVGLGVGSGVVLGLTAARSGGLPVLFPTTVWVRYVTAKWWLASNARVPIRLLSFLDDACTLGVMRRVGAVYQFRHVDFQAHLSGSSPLSGR